MKKKICKAKNQKNKERCKYKAVITGYCITHYKTQILNINKPSENEGEENP